MPDLLKKSSYYYDLPRELIAQFPLAERSESRLMVIDKAAMTIEHRHFYEIVDLMEAGDVLVINNSQVIPARLFGYKDNGTRVEVLLLHETGGDTWRCLVQPGNRIKKPQKIAFAEDFSGFISLSDGEGIREIRFEYDGDFWHQLTKYGHVPLPPYISRNDKSSDKADYQTVYAKEKGSVAAPTAGLHFTHELLDKLKAKGIVIAEVILHVGLGTFRPVKVENILEHNMHTEICMVPEQSAAIINKAKQEGRKVTAVGTTSIRTLESFAENGLVTTGQKWSDIFIYPGKEIQIADCMITNFHLPESTLIMLVAAFAGYDLTMKAYKTAVEERYRFFSYGDAMFIK